MFHVIDDILAAHIVLDIRHYPGSTLVDEYRNGGGGGGGGGHHDWYCLLCKTVLLAWAESVVGWLISRLVGQEEEEGRARQGNADQVRSDRSGAGGFLFFCFSLAGRGFREGERLGCEKEEQRERELISVGKAQATPCHVNGHAKCSAQRLSEESQMDAFKYRETQPHTLICMYIYVCIYTYILGNYGSVHYGSLPPSLPPSIISTPAVWAVPVFVVAENTMKPSAIGHARYALQCSDQCHQTQYTAIEDPDSCCRV